MCHTVFYLLLFSNTCFLLLKNVSALDRTFDQVLSHTFFGGCRIHFLWQCEMCSVQSTTFLLCMTLPLSQWQHPCARISRYKHGLAASGSCCVIYLSFLYLHWLAPTDATTPCPETTQHLAHCENNPLPHEDFWQLLCNNQLANLLVRSAHLATAALDPHHSMSCATQSCNHMNILCRCVSQAGLPAIVGSLPAWSRSRQFNNSGGRLGTGRASQQQAHPQSTNHNTNSVATPSNARPNGRAQATTGAGSTSGNVTGTTALPRSLHTVGVPESFPMQSSQYNSSGGRLGGTGVPENASQSSRGRGVESDGSREAGSRLAGTGQDSVSLSGSGVAQTQVVREGLSTEELRQRRLQRFGSQS